MKSQSSSKEKRASVWEDRRMVAFRKTDQRKYVKGNRRQFPLCQKKELQTCRMNSALLGLELDALVWTHGFQHIEIKKYKTTLCVCAAVFTQRA